MIFAKAGNSLISSGTLGARKQCGTGRPVAKSRFSASSCPRLQGFRPPQTIAWRRCQEQRRNRARLDPDARARPRSQPISALLNERRSRRLLRTLAKSKPLNNLAVDYRSDRSQQGWHCRRTLSRNAISLCFQFRHNLGYPPERTGGLTPVYHPVGSTLWPQPWIVPTLPG